MATAFIHGFLLAFGLILPLGVQNVFIFNQGAVQKRFTRVVPAVLTASLCDTLLITLAVLGVSLVILSSALLKTILLGVGALFLIYMGFSTWRSRPAKSDADADADAAAENNAAEKFAPRKQIAFAASVSLLNPHAILDTVGVIGAGSLTYAGAEKAVFTAACILVSWIWFAGLAFTGKIVGELDKSGRLMLIVNKVSALIIWGAAAYIAYSVLK